VRIERIGDPIRDQLMEALARNGQTLMKIGVIWVVPRF
jgi:hypothetical protein